MAIEMYFILDGQKESLSDSVQASKLRSSRSHVCESNAYRDDLR
jgi:hypothetical protein